MADPEIAIVINAQQLSDAIGVRRDRAERCVRHVNALLKHAQCTTVVRAAHLLGQVGHESGRLRYVRELWGPTRQQLRYEPGTTLARRLGNTQAGDGARYMGRGWIQVTGRANYRTLTQRMRMRLGNAAPDFEAEPELLEQPRWAALSAADFWARCRLNDYADADDIVGLTIRVNGGTNGLHERQALRAQAQAVLMRAGV